MKQSIYSIYDTVAQVFNKPFTDHNNATAIRSFTASVENQKHKDDYALYLLGEFDDSNGQINAIDNPVRILSGLDVKKVSLLEEQAM